MTTLVTGATGNVGSAIVTELLTRQRPVRALVRSASRARAILPAGVELVEGDITNLAAVRQATAGVTAVFHASGLPEQWHRDTEIFERVNVGGTRNAIYAALEAGVQAFVYTSTIDVFEWPSHGTFDETRIDARPKATYYERSKQAADRLVVAALDAGLPARFVHPAGVYGPAPVITPGLNQLLVGLATNKVPVLIPGGLPVVHATDCARLHLAVEHSAVGSRYIASERYLSLTEVAHIVRDSWPNANLPRMVPRWLARAISEAGEVLASVTNKPPLVSRGELAFLTHEVRPDAGRASRELGWSARPFESGVSDTLHAMNKAGQLRV
ncbi:NAD-dependent epimerase/dehydratase family protein [Nonomuraea sp. NPDC050663]|uniref:NAD-dependent epimerase/dehydratase family protein n=1 Tax=Nonomuraea sp. NPDC050663 TaxID=3364370 RepID=UPI0037A695E0